MLLIKRLGAIRPLAQTGLFLLAVIAGIFGLASAVLPAWFVLAVLLVPAVAAIGAVRPEFALTAGVALVCGLIHPAFVPRVPVFGGLLAAADAALVMLAIFAVWSLATRTEQTSAALVAPKTPVAGARLLAFAVGLFALMLAVAVIVSLAVREVEPAHVLGETRDLLYWLVLPIAVAILHSRQRQQRFIVSFVVLGGLFSLGQVLQGVFNIPVFGAQGISALETLGRQEDATTRANTLGLNVIIFALLLTVGAHVVGAVRKAVFYPVAGLLLVGIVLTFGRTTFAAVVICLFLVVWWLNPKKLPQFIGLFVVVVAAGSVLATIWKPDSFAAVVFRFTSIGEEIDHGYSAQWRFWEFQAMLPHMQEHPLLGIGLGADYKGLGGSSARPDLNRYMHNAYFYMAGKMGFPALMSILLAITAIFSMGRRAAKSTAEPWVRLVGAASAAMMIRFLFASVTEPHLMSDYGVVNIAIAGALVYLVARHVPAGVQRAGSDSVQAPAGQHLSTATPEPR